MDKLIFTSLLGSQRLDNPSRKLNNEIANISTVGFKKSYVNVQTTMKLAGPGWDSRFLPSNVHTERVSLAPGQLMYTGSKMDIAMDGNTVLGVNAPNGELAFTRRGDLRVNAAGIVETGSGHAVRGENGPISVPAGYLLEATADGSVYATNPNRAQGDPGPVLVGRMLLRDASEVSLERRADGLFKALGDTVRDDGDFATGSGRISLTVGALEGSNVTAYDAMVRLVDLTRAYENNVKIIKEMKSLDESGTSMMRSS